MSRHWNTTHGFTVGGRIPPEYYAWHQMVKRCSSAKHHVFRYYGGRGIAVCDRWLNDFAAFFADMGQRPTSKHSIGRIDNNGHYEPTNCRWETRAQQAINQRSNRLETYMGETKPLAEWARYVGLPYKTVHNRLNRCGWSLERALTTPIDESRWSRRRAA